MQGGYLSMDLTDTYQQSTVIICSYCMGMICSAAKDATKPDCDTNPSITFWLISLTEPSLPLTVLVAVVSSSFECEEPMTVNVQNRWPG